MNTKEQIECILEDDCPDCRIAVGIGQMLAICNRLKYDDCNNLYEKINNETISPEELVDIIVSRAKNTSEEEIADEIKQLMK